MVAAGAALLLLLGAGGCTAARYKAQADREVYRILDAKQQRALGETFPFSIDPATGEPLSGLAQVEQPLLLPGDVVAGDPEQARLAAVAAGSGKPVAVLSLNKAVEIAVSNSREYQTRKEELFLAALDLTTARHQWSPIFSAMLSGRRDYADGVDAWAGSSAFGVDQLLATGGRITLGLSTDFLRYITGDSRPSAASVLSADFVQPLWRGAGQRVAQENLTQAERNVIYAVRDFARFHRSYAVQVASQYYLVLQQRDIVHNEWSSYRRLYDERERAENLAKAGRLPEFQLDQTRQNELRARNRYVLAVKDYGRRLDRFKMELGLDADGAVDVDVQEMARLAGAGLVNPNLTLAQATRQALALRLDLLNAEDGVTDAERKVEVARNGLAAEVNLVGSAAIPSSDDDNRALRLNGGKGLYSGGLDVDLPLERTAERNSYRQSLITLERARRNAVRLRDTVKLEVRDGWRRLEETRESYEIQQQSLALAQRRVAGTGLLLQAGRATARDVLDAQASLLEAQNGLTQALVDYTISRLTLWRDVETLLVAPDGELLQGTAPQPQPDTLGRPDRSDPAGQATVPP